MNERLPTNSASLIDETPPIAALIDSDSFRDVCKSYSELYGVGIKLFSVEGQKLVDIRANNGEHCGYLFSVQSTRVMCTALVEKIRCMDIGLAGPITVDCFSGLRYKIMPVVHDGTVLGRLIFGPYAPPDLNEPPPSLQSHGPDLDVQRLGGYLQNIVRVPEPTAMRILENMRHVLDVLIYAAYKAALTSRLHITSIAGAFADLGRTNASLKDANTRLQELDRLKSNFVATVSHELRTPLTSVIGYSEMLLEGMAGGLNEEQRQYIGVILEKGESLLNMISQILDMSRIESGHASISKTSTDVREVLRLSTSDIEPQIKKRSVRLTVETDPKVRPIEADPDKLRRIITNLLGNAAKFTPVGGWIRLRASVAHGTPMGALQPDLFEPERNDFLEISVADNGIGIPPDKLERIFDSFYQVDNSATREFGGTGLGLAIVRNFVQAHRGSVQVSSREGEGSAFTVRLPYVSEPVGSPVAVDGMLDLPEH